MPPSEERPWSSTTCAPNWRPAAGQTYYYLVGHDGWDSTGNLGTIRSFTTAPSGREPFTFTAFGDEGVTYDAVANTNLIRAQNPAFHLHAGDISYAEDGGGGLITDSYDPRLWDSFFTQVEPVASSTPWQVAVGNHEMETWYSPNGYGGQFDRFAFPGSTSYYTFTYGNVAVISLDANDISNEIPANLGYSGGAQTAWLAATSPPTVKSKDIDFIVAYFHHCAYCTCDGALIRRWRTSELGAAVRQILRRPRHQRSQPHLRTHRPDQERLGDRRRTDRSHDQAGDAGHDLYHRRCRWHQPLRLQRGRQLRRRNLGVSAFIKARRQTPETVAWSRIRYTGYCLLVVDSAPANRRGGTSTLTVRGLSSTGNELDRFTLARKS